MLDGRTSKRLGILNNLSASSSIRDVKREFQRIKRSMYADRQSFRIEPRGKALKDEELLETIGLKDGGKIYFKDLGPQVGWATVFLCEYAGPLVIYLLFYSRPALIYASGPLATPVTHIAAACWSFHYAKRLLETLFVHRFSHSTMPIRNLFKNCSYYWGFAAFVAYYVNHPLYTQPKFGNFQIYGGLAGFLINELGNLSCHVAFRNLRPPGSKERKIPRPTSNPFTYLFNFVSCPNYTYEVGAWLSFAVMTQAVPALLFTLLGFYQMSVWAIGKHRNYRKEFKDYPRRKAILPFLL